MILVMNGMDAMDKPLLAVLLRIPDDAARGFFLALLVRQVVIREDTIKASLTGLPRIAVLQSTLIFTTLNFVINTIMISIGHMVTLTPDPSSMPDNLMLLSLAGMITILAFFRFQWVPIAAAAGMPALSFARNMGGGVLLSLRIFLLWLLISIPSVLLMGMTTEAIAMITHTKDMKLLPSLYTDGLLLLSVILSFFTTIVQTTASIHAIKYCTKGEI